MATIFERRVLSPCFNQMNVVLLSRFTVNRQNELTVIGEVGLDRSGRLSRRLLLKLEKHTLESIKREFDIYHDRVVFIINQLALAQDWANENFVKGPLDERVTGEVYNSSMSSGEEFPFYIHGVYKGKEINLYFYGHNMNGFSIGVDLTAGVYLRDFNRRFDELINHFHQHLTELDAVSIPDLLVAEPA